MVSPIILLPPLATSQTTAITIMAPLSTTSMQTIMALVTPMTTVFQPPCGSIINKQQMGLLSCLPEWLASMWRHGGFYSPGVCPRGYSTGCVGTGGSAGDEIRMREKETRALCVPRGWTCYREMTGDMGYSWGNGEVYSAPAWEVRWRPRDLVVINATYAADAGNIMTDSDIVTATSNSTLRVTDQMSSVSITAPASVPTSTATTFATVTGTSSHSHNTAILSAPGQEEPTTSPRPKERNQTQDNMRAGELSGIVFGVCTGLLLFFAAIWCVMKHWEQNGCFDSCCDCCAEPKRWEWAWASGGRGGSRIYSPSMDSRRGSPVSPVTGAPIMSTSAREEVSGGGARAREGSEMREEPGLVPKMTMRGTGMTGETLVR